MSHDIIATAIALLSWQAALLGIAGSFLVTSTTAKHRRHGFACWIASNVGLIIVLIRSDLPALVAMQSVYLVTSVLGWLNNRTDKP